MQMEVREVPLFTSILLFRGGEMGGWEVMGNGSNWVIFYPDPNGSGRANLTTIV